MNNNKYVYWEKQGNDRMCGLHCINSILQGPYYNEASIALIGKELDEQEKKFLKNQFDSSKELTRYNSSNVLDDGFINISVLVECLRRKKIVLKNVSETDLIKIITNDHHQDSGYICNLKEHWFSVRKIHNTWYILDSLKKAPLYIKDVQLKFYFNDVIKKYHVFMVQNENPYMSLPKPNVNFETKRPNQFYISVNEIKEVVISCGEIITEEADDDTTTSSELSGHKNNKQTSFKWPENGGRRLNEAESGKRLNNQISGATNNSFDDLEADEDLKMALKLSMQEYAKTMQPPADVSDTEDCITVLVKFPTKKIQKNFSRKQYMGDIFYWMDYETTRDRNSGDPYFFRKIYTIYQGFPKRKFIRNQNDTSIELHTANKVEQVANKTLGELDFEKEESFMVS